MYKIEIANSCGETIGVVINMLMFFFSCWWTLWFSVFCMYGVNSTKIL